MEKKKNELTNAGYIIDNETYLTYDLESFPQGDQTMILVPKDKLRRGTLMIEAAENLLDDKFEAMKDLNGWNEEGEKQALVVQKNHLRKH